MNEELDLNEMYNEIMEEVLLQESIRKKSDSDNSDDIILNQILDLLNKLNGFDYKFLDSKGKEIDEDDDESVYKYTLQTPSQFESNKAGVCWDYVAYEAKWFKEHSIPYKTFYIGYHKEDEYDYSHTFLVFYLGKYCFYFESSWYNLRGIWKADNERDIIGFTMDRHAKENNISNDKSKIGYCFEYNALDSNTYGMNAVKFPSYIIHNGKKVRIPKIFKNPRKIL